MPALVPPSVKPHPCARALDPAPVKAPGPHGRWQARALLLAAACGLLACPGGPTVLDAGVEPGADGGPEPTPCDSSADCAALGAVCRRLACQTDVPCADDLECGLGEHCLEKHCRFGGCTQHADCSTGFCHLSTFSCAECGSSGDCPSERPVCDTALLRCVQCSRDEQCQPPGPAHCSPLSGRCVDCLSNTHCPNGLFCNSGNACVGAQANSPCPDGIACGQGLMCVNVNQAPTCLTACSLYQPSCALGQICFALSDGSSATGLIFDSAGPLGVCFAAQSNLRGLHEPCVRSRSGSNCQRDLQCVPETASLALCRRYCEPFASGTCAAGEKCARFVGDSIGREFGLCLPDTGFGAKCGGDAVCRGGLSCQPYDVPSTPNELGTLCQFDVGQGQAMSACGPSRLADGGMLVADRACRSGHCVSDPLVPSPRIAPYFCYAACAVDSDCGDAGACDAEFAMTTAHGTQGALRGCRPKCESDGDCSQYDAGVSCRVRVVSSPTKPVFTTNCSSAPGALPAGGICIASPQCRSGLCVMDDSRGVRRGGQCMAPCREGDSCESDGGAPLVPLKCQPTTHLISRGSDGVAGTADDAFVTRTLCSGAPCTSDLDCQPDGGVFKVCAAELSPSDVRGAVVLRCRSPTPGVLRGGRPCTIDSQCQSGACGTLQAPSSGTGRACFEACTPTTVCGAGMTCRAGGLALQTQTRSVSLDSCAP